MLAPRRRRRRGHERRARPPRDLRLAGRAARRVPRSSWRARRRRCCGTARSSSRCAGRGRSSPSTCPTPSSPAAARASSWRGHEVRLPVPGAHNALNAAAALEACALAGADAAAAAAALADFRGAGRRFQRLGHTPAGAARRRRLRPPPDRGRGDDRRRARTLRRAAGRRGLPAAPVLAHAPRSPASSARRWRSADVAVRARRLPGARARRGLPGRQRPAGRRGGRRPRRRPPGPVAAGLRRRRAGRCAALLRDGDLVPGPRRGRRRRARPPPRGLRR